MQAKDIYDKLDYGLVNAKQLADLVVSDPKLLFAVVDGLHQGSHVRNTCANALRIVSAVKPRLLYPWFNAFADRLNSAGFFIKVELIYILANLAKVDSQNKLDEFLDTYFEPLEGRNLLVARALIRAALRIAAAKPRLAERIAEELLRVEKGKHENEESRRVIYEVTLETLEQMNSLVVQKLPA